MMWVVLVILTSWCAEPAVTFAIAYHATEFPTTEVVTFPMIIMLILVR